MSGLLLLRGLGFIAAGALFWAIYFDQKDRLQPEPRRLLLAAFGLGLLAAPAALLLYRVAEAFGAPRGPGASPGPILAYCLLLIGPIEEGVKFAAFRAVVYRWPAFDERIDGLVYAGVIGIGFASLENLLYLPLLNGAGQAVRAIGAPLTHSLFAAIWGFGLAQARLDPVGPLKRRLWQTLPLLAAMLLHGLYDFVLFAWNAPALAGGIVLLLWIAVAGRTRRLIRERTLRTS